jgi:hypothetical protein
VIEQVGGHAGAVAHVVTDVVGDGGRVARVVLGDVVLDLAHEVRADVGGLGEDATTDAHEHREECGSESEALQDGGRVTLEPEDHDRGTEEPQTDGGHPDRATGAEGDPHGRIPALAPVGGGRGDPEVRPDGERHAHVPDRRGEAGPDDEEHRAADLDVQAAIGRQQEQEEERHHDEHRQCLELPGEVRRRALLHRSRDGLHVRRALAGTEHLLAEHHPHAESDEGDDGDHRDQRQVPAGQVRARLPSGKRVTSHCSPPKGRAGPVKCVRTPARVCSGCGQACDLLLTE